MKRSPSKKAGGKAAGGGSRLWVLALGFGVAALVFLAGLALMLAVKLANAPRIDPAWLAPAGVYLGSLLVVWCWLALIRFRGDNALVTAFFLLTGLGILVQTRMGNGPQQWNEVAVWVPYGLGVAAFLLCVTGFKSGRIDGLRLLQAVAWLGAVAVLAGMLVVGRRYRGGVYLAGNINPTECVKPLLALFLAGYLVRRQNAFSETQAGIPMPPWGTLLGLGILWGIPMVLVFLLKDFGLMALLNGMLVIMLFAVSRRTGWLAVGVAAVMAAGFAVQLVSAHVRVRFDVWQNPFADPTGKGWQVLQGLSAMYSGGLWGAGIGSGTPQAVPIVTSDFVYAALAEEIGAVGCFALLLVYTAVCLRGLRAAGAARTPFVCLFAVGLTASFALQTLLNIGGVVKAIPMTGITLPLISHGGSSLVITLLAAGLLAAASDPEK